MDGREATLREGAQHSLMGSRGLQSLVRTCTTLKLSFVRWYQWSIWPTSGLRALRLVHIYELEAYIKPSEAITRDRRSIPRWLLRRGWLSTTWCAGPARARHLPIRRHGITDCVDDDSRWAFDCDDEDYDDGDHLILIHDLGFDCSPQQWNLNYFHYYTFELFV